VDVSRGTHIQERKIEERGKIRGLKIIASMLQGDAAVVFDEFVVAVFLMMDSQKPGVLKSEASAAINANEEGERNPKSLEYRSQSRHQL
jgi:hypothetical protein